MSCHRSGPAAFPARHGCTDVSAAPADPRLSPARRNVLPGQYRGTSLPPALDTNLLDAVAALGHAHLVAAYTTPLTIAALSTAAPGQTR